MSYDDAPLSDRLCWYVGYGSVRIVSDDGRCTAPFTPVQPNKACGGFPNIYGPTMRDRQRNTAFQCLRCREWMLFIEKPFSTSGENWVPLPHLENADAG